MDLRGKNVLITGGAKRIGRNLAIYFAQHGAHIICHYWQSVKEAKQLQKIINKQGNRCLLWKANLEKPNIDKQLNIFLKKHKQKVDVFVSNAANYLPGFFKKCSKTNFKKTFAVNVAAPLQISSFLVPPPQGECPAKRDEGDKLIIFIGDNYIHHPYESHQVYLFSKKILHNWASILAKKYKIGVILLSPTLILFPKHYSTKKKKSIIKKSPYKKLKTPADLIKKLDMAIKNKKYWDGREIVI